MYPGIALSKYLILAEEHDCLHYANYSPSLLMFNDGCNWPNEKTSHILSFSLPEARNPRQQMMQLVVARWISQDDCFDY